VLPSNNGVINQTDSLSVHIKNKNKKYMHIFTIGYCQTRDMLSSCPTRVSTAVISTPNTPFRQQMIPAELTLMTQRLQ
jgi:hypothetical protein